nr:hypothetical protein BaRGS_004325 [Batillaria attramentaria]
MYDFDSKTDVETAVNELAAAANNGELYIIADEAFNGSDRNNTSGRFSEFVTHLSNRVPSLHLWAAAVERVRVPSCVSVETLTRPLRCPPAVVREVEKAWQIDGGRGLPEYCERCADNITDILVELRVGQSGQDLQYRDAIILCPVARDDLPVVVMMMMMMMMINTSTLDPSISSPLHTFPVPS